MYCRNCGNKLLDSDKYCNLCGSEVVSTINSDSIEHEQPTEEDNKITKSASNNLPMNWWKFWLYFSFPFGIAFSILNLKDYVGLKINFITFLVLIINILMILLTCVAYYFMINRKKRGYELVIANLITVACWNALFSTLETISNNIETTFSEFFISFAIALVIIGIVWIYPNYIYFKKRKHLFSN